MACKISISLDDNDYRIRQGGLTNSEKDELNSLFDAKKKRYVTQAEFDRIKELLWLEINDTRLKP